MSTKGPGAERTLGQTTLQSLIDFYAGDMERRGCTPDSVLTNRNLLLRFQRWLAPEDEAVKLATITPERARNYITDCAAAFFTHFVVPLRAHSPIWWIGVFSPTIAAYLVAGTLGGWPEVRRLLASYTRWRLGWQWYLAATSLAIIPLGVALVYIVLGNPPTGPKPGVSLWTYPGLLLLTLLAGPLAEESGWRGFALPRM